MKTRFARPDAIKPRARIAKIFYCAAGVIALVLGVVGVFLPGLPTTPFILVAAACFAKGSPRAHRWMLQHRLLGDMVRGWEADRSLTRRTKTIAILSMTLTLSLSIWAFSGHPWMQWFLLITGLASVAVVLRIPTRTSQNQHSVEQ